MLRAQSILQAIFSAIIFCVLAPAQEFIHGTPTTTGGQTAAVQQGSAFTQGFLSGYERGFHAADLDFHVGRTDRKLDTFPDYRKATAGYRDGLGARTRYQQGYRQGFAQGYDDSFHSRHFSASVAQQAAQEVRSEKDEGGSTK